MTLPASGAISLNAVNIELQRSGTATLSMNDSDLRLLFGVASGQISMSSGYGKTWITSGANDYGTAGTYTWTSPVRGWNTLTVQAWGGGGGGSVGILAGTAATAGGQSSFAGAIFANGGAGAALQTNGGAGGTASGGTTNTTGGAGANSSGLGGAGGSSPNGGAGGTGATSGSGSGSSAGGYPGGGGGGWISGGGGGGGGYSTRSYTGYGTIAKNTGYTVVVGAAGAGHVAGLSVGRAGAQGRVYINWS